MVVTGALCESLTRREAHPGCRTCECFSLADSLGMWEGDAYVHDKDGEVSRLHGSGMDAEGFIKHHEFPRNVRRWTGTPIPRSLLRASLLKERASAGA